MTPSQAITRWAAVLAVAVLVPLAAAELASSSSKEALSLTSSHQLLSGLGLARLPGKLPDLPGQGAQLVQAMLPKKVHATEDDSRVFVVRLPPSQHYYSLLKSPPSVANSVSKQVEVGFRSNGKPARVYHWNIPVLKKMAAARRRSTQGSSSKPSKSPSKSPYKSKLGALGASRRKGATYHRVQMQHLQKEQMQRDQAHKDHLQKEHHLHKEHLLQQQQQQQQKLKQQLLDVEPEPAGPSPYYYAPAKKTSMHKLLGGNGKPHSMYVLEKSRAPAYYQRLLP